MHFYSVKPKCPGQNQTYFHLYRKDRIMKFDNKSGLSCKMLWILFSYEVGLAFLTDLRVFHSVWFKWARKARRQSNAFWLLQRWFYMRGVTCTGRAQVSPRKPAMAKRTTKTPKFSKKLKNISLRGSRKKFKSFPEILVKNELCHKTRATAMKQTYSECMSCNWRLSYGVFMALKSTG